MNSFDEDFSISKRKLEVMEYALSRMYNRRSDIKRRNLVRHIYLEPNNNIVAITHTGRYFRFHTEDEFEQHVENCKWQRWKWYWYFNPLFYSPLCIYQSVNTTFELFSLLFIVTFCQIKMNDSWQKWYWFYNRVDLAFSSQQRTFLKFIFTFMSFIFGVESNYMTGTVDCKAL